MKNLFAVCFLVLCSLQVGRSQFTVSGTITNEEGEPLSGVTVGASIPGGIIGLTDANGHYQLVLPVGSDAAITPHNNLDPLNGVSSFDMVLVNRHIAGIDPLDSPYKLIAADVNHSNTLSGLDTAILRNMVMGALTEFPNNTSWRFVDAGYVFPEPGNPWAAAFPEIFQVNAISGDITGVDFIGIKVGDVNGSSFTNLSPDLTNLSKIAGKVFYDQDQTCSETSGDTALKNWKVVATGTGGSFYCNSDADGGYRIFLPPGTYEVQRVPPNAIWGPCSPTPPSVTVPLLETAVVDFAEQAVAFCPVMEVELATSFIRRCFPSSYQVTYCNQGTVAASGVSVEVTLDPYFVNATSSLPFASVNGQTYTFQLGDLPAGACESFVINFEVSCDAVLGQTHCTYAHIFPDEDCLPPPALWNGADLVVTGECSGSEVVFTITNLGEDMTEPVPYVVIEDIMIQMQGDNLMLAQGQSTTVSAPANGATWRLEADEVANHPYETFASATVEGCGTNPNGGVSLGLVNLFPIADAKPYEDLDCQINVAAFDPNDKTGFPLGVGESHFIELGQEIQYLIRFQNTGTDTAFNIVVVDTLPPSLDPASLRLLGSSHPFELQLEGRGVAKFLFPFIMLPDSNVNEVASHGFVKFAIAQQPGLPIGTAIENEAGIYFDFNLPVVTNRSLHTIGEDFLLEVLASQTLLEGTGMEVFPNPFEAVAHFRFTGHEMSDGLLTVFDQQGRPVGATRFTGSDCRFDGSGLPQGVYFFRVDDAGRAVASGKIVVR